MPKPNHLANASGSIQEARRLIITQLQEVKVTEDTAEEYANLLELHRKLGGVRLTLEGMSRNFGGK